MRFTSKLIIGCLPFICTGVWAMESAVPGKVDLTVYNQDYALIREQRILELQKGLNQISIEDIPYSIDPTSLHFKSFTDPNGTFVREQNYDYDLVNSSKLMERYVGKDIQLERIIDNKPVIQNGTLLSKERIIKIGDNIVINPSGTIILPKLPDNLILKPTLNWKISAEKAGSHNTELAYISNGIKWNADYVVIAGKDDKTLDLTGWVTLDNRCGKRFEDANLKLMAGDVNKIRESNMRYAGVALYETMSKQMNDSSVGFVEKAFDEFHLYTLQWPVTIANNQTKQIQFTSASDVPMKKVFQYNGAENMYFAGYPVQDMNYGTNQNKKVRVVLEFKNSEVNHMGMPLPAGKIKVYKQDDDGSQQFIGEDRIDHTPKDEIIRINTGNAFDIVGERKQTSFNTSAIARTMDESFEIKLRNHKKEDVVVRVTEPLYRWSNWVITTKSQEYKKVNSQTIEYTVKVPKDGETVITYSVHYNW